MQLAEFRNEPLSDFKGNPAYHRRMEYALDEVCNELGREYDLVISGERVSTAGKIRSCNPSHPDQIVGIFSKADASLADRAILAAHDALGACAEPSPGSAVYPLCIEDRPHSFAFKRHFRIMRTQAKSFEPIVGSAHTLVILRPDDEQPS